MEFKCSHCNEVFKKNDLDENSKKELENHLKQIEESLFVKLKKELTKKYEEELKLVEAEKKEKHLHLKKLENEIEGTIDNSWEVERLKGLISALKEKKTQLISEIKSIKPVQKDYDEWLEYEKNAKIQSEKTIEHIELFLRGVKKVIIKELTNLNNLCFKESQESYLTYLKNKAKEMILPLEDQNDSLSNDIPIEKRNIYEPVFLEQVFFLESLSQDKLNSLFMKGGEELDHLYYLVRTIVKNIIFSELKTKVNNLESDYPFIKSTFFFTYETHRAYLLEWLMRWVVDNLCKSWINTIFIIKKQEKKEIEKIKEMEDLINKKKNMPEKIKQLEEKYNTLKKEQSLLINKIQRIMKA